MPGPCERCETYESNPAHLNVNGESVIVQLCHECRILYKVQAVPANPMTADFVSTNLYFKGFSKSIPYNRRILMTQWVWDNYRMTAVNRYEAKTEEECKEQKKEEKDASKKFKLAFPEVKQHYETFKNCLRIIEEYIADYDLNWPIE